MPPLFLTSDLLPVPHGFSTREGGVSQGPFASLNLAQGAGDGPEAVAENLRRLAAAAGARLERLHTVSQVHGDAVREAAAGEGSAAGTAPGPEGEADALWTAEPGAWVGVRTADCVPVLLVDPDGRRVAAVHSGWRGTDARIAARAVEALARAGSAPARLLAAVGPCIQRCCYEVDAPLARRFDAGFGPGVAEVHGEKGRLDLPAAVRRTLEAAGVPATHVDVLPHCTACDARRFFSHRRDAGRTGRHLNFVAHAF